MKDDRFYLVLMADSIRYIEEDTSAGEEVFLATRTLRDAVMRNLQILTDASKRVSPDMKQRYPDVDWAGMSQFRNVAVHDYTQVRWDVVWRIIQQDVHRLKSQVERILADLS